MYEGIFSMCFCCDRIGHRQESYGQCISPPEKAAMEGPSQRQEVKQNEQTGTNFGEWLLVTRKENPVKNGCNRGTKLTQLQPDVSPRGTKGKDGNLNSRTPF